MTTTEIKPETKPETKAVAAPVEPQRQLKIVNGRVHIEFVSDIRTLAFYVFDSQIIPGSYKKAADVFSAMMLLSALKMDVLLGLNNVYVINNRPMLFGDTPLALVRGSGLLESFKEELLKDKDGNVDGYRCTSKRKGMPDPVVTEFTKTDAELAGLWGKTNFGKPSPWVLYPKRMLKMRARSENLKDSFSDILLGVSILEYDANETEETARDVSSKGTETMGAADFTKKFTDPPPLSNEELT